MKSFISLLIICSLSLSAHAQKKGTWTLCVEATNSVTGTFIHDGKLTGVLMRPDSTMIDSLSKQRTFTVDGTQHKFIMRLSHPEYETTYCPFEISHYYKRERRILLEYVSMRRLTLSERNMMLDDLVVKATKVKFVHKGDTLVYNADAFQLSDGSMLDALINQLPGVELKDDGRIYVNGRFVSSLMLNGRDFFKGDNKVMLDNLPAYMVQSLNVYEKESEISRLMSVKVDEGEYVMDVRLKKQYSIGWIANASAGYGTEERYAARIFGVRFTPQSHIALYAGLNNLNDDRKPGQNTDWSPSDLSGGLFSTKTGGLDYYVNDKQNKFHFNGNARANYTDRDRVSETKGNNYIGNTLTRAWNENRNKNFQFLTSHTMRLSPKMRGGYGDISVSPQFVYSKYDNFSKFLGGTFHALPSEEEGVRDSLFENNLQQFDWINRQMTETLGKGHSVNAGLLASFSSIVPHTNDGYTIKGEVSYSNAKSELFDKYQLGYAVGGEESVNRHYNDPNEYYSYKLGGSYLYRPTTEVMISAAYEFQHSYNERHNDIYRLDQLAGWDWENTLGVLPSMADELLQVMDRHNSYTTGEHIDNHRAEIGLTYNKTWNGRDAKKKSTYEMKLIGLFNYEEHRFNYHGFMASRNRYHQWLPNPSAEIKYRTPGYRHEWLFNYSMKSASPSMFNMIDYTFNDDPLNIRVGNPDLDYTMMHAFDISYRADQWLKGTEKLLRIRAGFDITHNAVAMGYVYDPMTGIKTHRPENVNGNKGVRFNVSFTTPIDKARKLSLYTYTATSYKHVVDIVGVGSEEMAMKNTLKHWWLRETLRLDYKIGKSRVGFRGLFNLTDIASARENYQSFQIVRVDYGLNAMIQLMWGLQLDTDLTMYNRYGYDDAALNTNELVWNAGLTKSILKGNLIFKLEGFDILGNLSSVQHSINGQGRTETWMNTIPSYAMLRMTYRFNKEPKKINK